MKRRYFSVFFAVVLSFLLIGTVSAANEYENNNSADSANSIAVNENVVGSIEHRSDADWYKVFVPSSGAVTFQFEHKILSSTDSYWGMYLYHSDAATRIYGEDVYWTIDGNENYTTTSIGLASGTYYIKIAGYSSSRYETSPYTLRVNHTPSDVWETEINNSTDAADQIEVNADYYGAICGLYDKDWYKVTIPEKGYATFRFEHAILSSTNPHWKLYFYQSDGVTPIYGENVVWKVLGNENLHTEAFGLDAGTYYIKIVAYSEDTRELSPYTLRVDHTPSQFWESEINSDPSTADPIGVNTDYYGAINGDNDYDWYAVTIPEDGYASFHFSHPDLFSSDAYWKMYLYQSDGVTPIYGEDEFWTSYGNKNISTAKLGLAAGTYYIKVGPYSKNEPDDSVYTLRVNHTPSDTWETEINNHASSANVIPVNTPCYGSIGGYGDADWYAVDLKAKAEMIFRFTHEPIAEEETYWKVIFYSGDGVSEIGETLYVSGSEGEASLNLGEREPGRYYFKVAPDKKNTYDTSTYVLNLMEKHDHIFTAWTTTEEPTCTEPGGKESACDICGFITTGSIEADGHKYGEWTVDTQPQCDAEGSRSRKCLVCGDVQTEAMEILPHQFGEAVHISGSKLFSPIVYHKTCPDCGYVEVTEDDRYSWMLPTLIGACVLLVSAIAAAVVMKNRTKLFKTHFTCPYCFEKHKMSEAQFRCSNNRCKDVPDVEMTKYENGDVKTPKLGKVTFSSTEVKKGEKFIPKSAVCPECSQVTHKVICPSCHNILPESALLGDDMIISIVGSRDTGKSHFVGVIINELMERIAPAFGASFEGFDDTVERYEKSFGRKLYVDLQKLDLTQSSLQNVNNGAYKPLIYSLKFRINKGGKDSIHRYTLVFFDTAGEDLDDADTMSTVNKYICKSAGIIFLLDPMKIPAVAAQLDDDTISRASSVNWSSATRSDDILVRVSNLIRNDRGLRSSDKIDIPVAVVFSKFDAVESIVPKGSAILNNSPHCREKAFVLSDWHNVNSEVQGLLKTWGADSFLSQLDVNYTDSSCFAVSSLGLNNNPQTNLKINRPRPHRIEDPLLWILMKLKVIGSKK